jgi:hypothetical protein
VLVLGEASVALTCVENRADAEALAAAGTTAQAVYLDPTGCAVWRWWVGLHYETRDQLVRMSRRAGVADRQA